MRLALQALLWGTLFAATSAQATIWSGWSSAVRGNLRSVSMGGANLGLADDFFGAMENPAGSSMTIAGVSLIAAQNRLQDGSLSARPEEVLSSTVGLAANHAPWGFSLGFWEPNFEYGTGTTDQLIVREFHFGGSRVFLKDRLSLGVSAVMGSAEQTLGSSAVARQAWGGAAGILYRFPKRILVGGSIHSRIYYSGLNGNEVDTPARIGLGVGYIPNRFFRVSAALRWIDSEQNARNFSAPERLSRISPSWQPHLGFAYRFLHLRKVHATAYVGGYYEPPRFQDSAGRSHGTFGLEVHPWFMILAGGVDLSTAYRNYVAAVGVNATVLMQTLRIIPKAVPAPSGGLLPSPFRVSDDWMIRTLQDDPENSFQEIVPTPEEIRKNLSKFPENLKNQGVRTEDDWSDLNKDLQDLADPFSP